MASAGNRSGDRHVHPPVAYRPPLDVRPLLEARMEATGLKASAIITAALREYLGMAAADTEAGITPPPRAASGSPATP